MTQSKNSEQINITTDLIKFINKSQEFIIQSDVYLNSINESRFS